MDRCRHLSSLCFDCRCFFAYVLHERCHIVKLGLEITDDGFPISTGASALWMTGCRLVRSTLTASRRATVGARANVRISHLLVIREVIYDVSYGLGPSIMSGSHHAHSHDSHRAVLRIVYTTLNCVRHFSLS